MTDPNRVARSRQIQIDNGRWALLLQVIYIALLNPFWPFVLSIVTHLMTGMDESGTPVSSAGGAKE